MHTLRHFDTASLVMPRLAGSSLSGLVFGLSPQGWWVRSIGGQANDYTASDKLGDVNLPLTQLAQRMQIVAQEDIDALMPTLERAKWENPLTWIPDSRERYGSGRDWETFLAQVEFLGYEEALAAEPAGTNLWLQGSVESRTQLHKYRSPVTAKTFAIRLRDMWLQLVAAQGRGERILIPETLYREEPTGNQAGSVANGNGAFPPERTMWLDIDLPGNGHAAGTGGKRFLTDEEAYDLADLGTDYMLGQAVERYLVHSGGGYQVHFRHALIDDQVVANFGLFLQNLSETLGVEVDWNGGLRGLPVRVWGSYRIKPGHALSRVEVLNHRPLDYDDFDNPFTDLGEWAGEWREDAFELEADDESFAARWAAKNRPRPTKPVYAGDVDEDGEDQRPGTKFARAVPAIDFLCELHPVTVSGTKFRVHRSNGRVPNDTDGTVLESEDGERGTVYFHSANGASEVDLETQKSYDAFGILIARCGGDTNLAARVAAAFMGKPSELVAFMRLNTKVSEIKKNLPKPPRSRHLTLEESFNAKVTPERLAGGRFTFDTTHITVGDRRLTPAEFVLAAIARGDAAKARRIMEKTV